MGLSYGFQDDFTVAQVEWNKFSYSHEEGTKATVTVIDPDMNKYPNAIDYLWVSIHSDSDPDLEGTRMTLFETSFDSGRFEREITFVGSPPSGRGFLHVVSGDTIAAKYVDTSFPANYTLPDSSRIIMTEKGIEVTASAIVGLRGPPLERLPASNFRLLSLEKEPVKDNSILVDQQVQLVSDLENTQNRTQPFAYLVQIKNEQDKVESLSWLTGNMTSFQKISSGVTWIPPKEGSYIATVFVWESIDNPAALSPPLKLEIRVKNEN